jgi:methylenetetrahydrofolate reductase (NADPH)
LISKPSFPLDIVDDKQKFKYASELIAEVRRKSRESQKEVTIFAGGYPESHIESTTPEEDLRNLKRKVETGVDVILTQVVFSAEKFVEFVRKCRDIGISRHVPIIPGLYIPYNFKELNSILKITKVSIDLEIYQTFEGLKEDPEEFQKFSLTFTTNMIKSIQQTSPEFIRGFNFFTMNNFQMIHKLVELVNFSEE